MLIRVDICSKSDKPCGTLGVAHVGGMCDQDRACSVNQDNGLSVAHTVAHELGHKYIFRFLPSFLILIKDAVPEKKWQLGHLGH